MFTTTQSYEKGLKRIDYLKTLEESGRLSQEDHYELRSLEVAAQVFEDQLDAEYKAEHAFMNQFEERFLASMER